MALHNVQIANPTAADVTVNAQTVPTNRVKALNLDDATADVWGFLNAGCAIAGVTGVSVERREEGGFLMERDQHDVL